MEINKMPIRTRIAFILLAAGWMAACSAEESRPPNFLVLIGDDMAVETLSCYGVGNKTAKTPNLDELCDQGIRFDNFWSQPVCSPTRATILSGQYGFRNGVGTPATRVSATFLVPALPGASENEEAPAGRGPRGGGGPANRAVEENPNALREGYTQPANVRVGLRGDTYGLPAALTADAAIGYKAAAVGKWHLADDDNGGLNHPGVVGFDYYAGDLSGGGVESYYAWSKVINGEMTDGQTGYATSSVVDDAISWIGDNDDEQPWLMWVAFNAPHTPFEAPPADLLSAETAAALAKAGSDADAHLVYSSMIEAMDTEIGRLLGAVDEEELANTYVIFLGDNGTPTEVTLAPFDQGRSKGTVYQGGVNVPFMVNGPNVDGGTVSKSLANSVDLYATILDLSGASKNPALENVFIDSVSLAPTFEDHSADVREYAYADAFGPTRTGIVNRRAIRNEQYKIVIDLQNDTEEFYDLTSDPYEHEDLLAGTLSDAAQANYESLTMQLAELLASH
jgi:arylsulfatase A-like enzyme